jgi:hypothetical protein
MMEFRKNALAVDWSAYRCIMLVSAGNKDGSYRWLSWKAVGNHIHILALAGVRHRGACTDGSATSDLDVALLKARNAFSFPERFLQGDNETA